MIVNCKTKSSVRSHSCLPFLAGMLTICLAQLPASAVTITFQEGVSGYTGTQDTFLQQDPANQGTNNGAVADFGWDGDDPQGTGNDVHGLIRFDSIFGAGGSQVPLGAEITEATLYLTVFNTGATGRVHRVLSPWSESTTYTSFCGGGCAEGVAYTPEVGTAPAGAAGEIAITVTSSVQAWSDGATNLGWMIRPAPDDGADGVDVRSREYATSSQRPRLVVRYNEGDPPVGNLVRQPYLQLLTPNSVTICWRSDVPSDSVVQYGITQGNLNQSASNPTLATDHFVTINSLSPDTTYFYNVGSTSGVQGGGTINHYFRTAPMVGSSTAFRVWVVGDSGTGGTAQAQVLSAMLTEAGAELPDFAVQLGDIAYNSGTDQEFTTNHFAPYANLLRNTVLWPTLGNHEGASTTSGSPGASTGPYYQSFVLPTAAEAGGAASGTEAYYSFDYANAHFISLNSEQVSRSNAGPMANWLQADLLATNQQWIIAFWHHPPYSKGTHNSDSAGDSGGRMTDMRENILPILEAGGVDLVLTGHSHSYERSFLIDGAYGYGTSPNFVTPNFATLEGNGNIIDDGDGRLVGTGAYVKSPGANANEGAVYVVAGHGGASTGGSLNHPVMYFSESNHGSCLMDIQGSTLTLRNIRSTGVVSDNFTIQKGDLPPRVAHTDPPKFSTLSSLTSIEVTFTQAVTGVDAADLTVNGNAATGLTVNAPDSYTFSVASIPGDGIRNVVLAADSIADALNPSLLFEGNSWTYTIDTQPPVVASESPTRGADVVILPQVQVTFSKPVTGVTAASLSVNGSPATALSGISGTSGPYSFSGYAPPAEGTASIVLSAGAIQDSEARPFAGDNWTYEVHTGLVINEFLASNNTLNTDENGEFDDWLEIYNPSTTSVDMSGMHLTDNMGFPAQYQIPNGVVIGPGQYLVFWCDSQSGQGPLHTNFNIARTGEDLALFDTAANGYALIDGFTFTEQTTDVTSGRYPNGTGPIVVLANATPGASNGGEPPVVQPLPIAAGATWKYFKGTAEPTTPIASLLWTQIGFDDSTWLEGPSGFGYGTDCDPYGTVLSDMRNPPSTPGYVSIYTRIGFSISNPAAMSTLELTLDYDDAYVAYINGVEVARSNVVGTPPTFSQLATADHECSAAPTPNPADTILIHNSFDLATLLVSGTNVLAIQAHNLTADSSDFTLLATMDGTAQACDDNGDCDDGNPCTTDVCNDGDCENTNNTNACNDGDLCTTGDVCGGGTCAGTPVSCPPGEACNSSNGQCEAAPVTLTFRQGADGYTGTVDTYIDSALGSQATASPIVIDGSPVQQVLLRFDDIFGNGPDQIPPGSTITSATLTLWAGSVANDESPNPVNLHLLLNTWSDTDIWADYGVSPWNASGGIQNDGVDALAAVAGSATIATVGTSANISVTTSLEAWSSSPSSNNGWAILPTGTNGLRLESSESATSSGTRRPSLSVTFTPPAASCDDDTDCDDGLFCNGVETCNIGTGQCVAGTSPCLPGEFCDEDADDCVDCLTNAHCDNDDVCDGLETCVGGVCQPGTPLDCDDGVACTDDSCDSQTGCVHTSNCPPTLTCNTGTGLCVAEPSTVSFQQGVASYTGTVDTFLHAGSATANNAAATILVIDGTPPTADERQVLLRFNNIFGNGTGQIPLGSTIQSATLSVNITNISTTGALLHRMLQPWNDTDNWNTWVGGIQANGVEAASVADVSSTQNTLGNHNIDVTASLAAWSAGAANHGWAWLPGGDDSWQFNSAEIGTVNLRPLLSVTYLAPTCDDNGDCDDGNPCTTDVCNDGLCENTNNTNACDDGNLCTTGDVCAGGTCAGTPVSCPPGETCNPSNGQCEEQYVPVAGDVIIAGFQATNGPTGHTPDGEFIELFNTTNQTISLENMQLQSRIGTGPVEWSLSADLTGKSIAPHSFFLIAEANVIADGGIRDIQTAGATGLDLATGEAGPGEQVVSLQLIIDGVHMDYVLYGNHLTPVPAGDAPGDRSFSGYPRTEVIRALTGTSFGEGMTRRATAEDLYAGFDVEGFYKDEDSLPDTFPAGVWTSLHSATNGSYVARSSATGAVGPPGCQNDGDCDDGLFCNGMETCNTGTGDCVPGAGDPCQPGEFCNEDTDACDECQIDAHCDDGLFCNGVETCDNGTCVAGTAPCQPGEVCDEPSDTCVQALMTCVLESPSALPGTTVLLHVFLADVADVRGYETEISITPTSGTGTVSVECPGGVLIDEGRPDYIFQGIGSTFPVTNCAALRAASARLSGGTTVGATPAYLATYELMVSGDAGNGSAFDISIIPSPGADLTNSLGQPIPFGTGPACTLAVTGCLTDGDCDDGDFCNGSETCNTGAGVCEAGTPPCGMDQFCNEGTDTCDECQIDAHCDDGIFCNGEETCVNGECVAGTPPCSPSEFCDESADICQQSIMTCMLESATAGPGTTVLLHVFLSEVDDVRGYETEISITPTSGTGTVSVECPGGVLIDEVRPDYIFQGIGSTFPVTNCAALRAASARLSGGTNVGATPAYLATYELTVSGDAADASTFDISIIPSPGADLTNSLGQPIPFATGPACTLTVSSACASPGCLTVDISIPGLTAGPVDRNVDFYLTACASPAVPVSEVVSFTPVGGNGVGQAVLTGVDLGTTWLAVREGHTLRRLVPVDLSGDGEDSVQVTLVPGDFQTSTIVHDDIVDILDFAILAARWNTVVNDCGVGLPQDCSLGADVTGDGFQATADFTALQINYLLQSDPADGCPPPFTSGKPRPGIRPAEGSSTPAGRQIAGADGQPLRGRLLITTAELARLSPETVAADLTGDGIVDAADIREAARVYGLQLLPEFDAKLRQLESAKGQSVPAPAGRR